MRSSIDSISNEEQIAKDLKVFGPHPAVFQLLLHIQSKELKGYGQTEQIAQAIKAEAGRSVSALTLMQNPVASQGNSYN